RPCGLPNAQEANAHKSANPMSSGETVQIAKSSACCRKLVTCAAPPPRLAPGAARASAGSDATTAAMARASTAAGRAAEARMGRVSIVDPPSSAPRAHRKLILNLLFHVKVTLLVV